MCESVWCVVSRRDERAITSLHLRLLQTTNNEYLYLSMLARCARFLRPSAVGPGGAMPLASAVAIARLRPVSNVLLVRCGSVGCVGAYKYTIRLYSYSLVFFWSSASSAGCVSATTPCALCRGRQGVRARRDATRVLINTSYIIHRYFVCVCG